MNNRTVDWAKIRAEYVNGNCSLTDLAKKYGVKNGTVRSHSAAEKWGEERSRKRKKKADKVAEKLHEKDVNDTVKQIERCCRAAGKLIDKINKGIAQVDKNIFVATDEKTVTEKTEEDDGVTVTNLKIERNFKTKRYDTLVDTKKIAELSKSLLNIKQILTGNENMSNDDSSGIIEIPAMQELSPPEEVEDDE